MLATRFATTPIYQGMLYNLSGKGRLLCAEAGYLGFWAQAHSAAVVFSGMLEYFEILFVSQCHVIPSTVFHPNRRLNTGAEFSSLTRVPHRRIYSHLDHSSERSAESCCSPSIWEDAVAQPSSAIMYPTTLC